MSGSGEWEWAENSEDQVFETAQRISRDSKCGWYQDSKEEIIWVVKVCVCVCVCVCVLGRDILKNLSEHSEGKKRLLNFTENLKR